MSTSCWSREEAELWGERSHYPWDPFHIHDNFLTDIGGDGIVVQYASGSKVEHNTVERAASEHGGMSANGVNVAVWPWNADRVEFRNNHVFGTVRSITDNDGSASNADSGNTGGIYEHNLSHDNEGGFMMWCGCWGMTTDITVRYNVSLNGGKSMEVQKNWKDPSQGMVYQPARVNLFYGQSDSRLYNNTYLLPVDDVNIAFTDFWLDDNSVNANNVFLAQPGTTVSENVSEMPNSNVAWRNNVYGGLVEDWPTVGADANTVMPDLALLDGVGLDRLKFTGEGFAAAGYPIADAGETDMLSNPVPSNTAPDVGAWQFNEFTEAETLADGGFETDDAWAFNGAVERVTEGARNGSAALQVGAGGSAVATADAAINRTYRLVTAVKADGESAPKVRVELPGGFVLDAEASGDADADGWQPVTAVFRTAWDASTFTVPVSGASGLADDVSVEGVADLVVDGAFEALLNTPWQPVSPVEGTPTNSWLPGDKLSADGPAYTFERSEDSVTGNYSPPVPVRGALGGWPAAPAENRFTFVTPNTDYELGVWAKTSTPRPACTASTAATG